MTIQHDVARKLLPIIASASKSHRLLSYQMVAAELGRPKDNARMVAQVCDLMDAAAALAGVPLLALIIVRVASGEINPKAWAGNGSASNRRQAIIDNSLAHRFTEQDFRAIADALDRLDGKSNIEAWKFVRATLTRAKLDHNLEGSAASAVLMATQDAIDDIGTDTAVRRPSVVFTYARDPQVRAAVMRRAGGRCEFCNAEGFICENGERYLESHHIIALASDGADKMSNVIALCAGDHREAHFGKRRASLEAEMIAIVQAAERHSESGR